MDTRELRLEALKLAQQDALGQPTNIVVDRARAYADFVTGKSDAEIIDGVRELAKQAG